MAYDGSPRLSKSRYQYGLQCPKRLWLEHHRKHLADPIDEVTQSVFDRGQVVGEVARRRFPGVLVEEDHTQSEAALQRTRELLDDGVQCLHEPAFFYDGVLVRVDILLRGDDGLWDVIEVKSSSKQKDEHLTDVAVQTYVIVGAGLAVGRTQIMHLNPGYVYQGGDYDLAELFTLVDLTSVVVPYLDMIPSRLEQMREMLQADCPECLIGGHCHSPYPCNFTGYCHAFLPEAPVTEIPRIGRDVLSRLLEEEIYDIREVPLTFSGLTTKQRGVCHLVQTGEPRYGDGLAFRLDDLDYPIHFLDFETCMPALPVYADTHPYETLPTQWSCHALREDGSTAHAEFLHDERTDPRGPFAESLLATLLPVPGPILVYTGYEERILKALAQALPDHESDIGQLLDRLVDLAEIIRDHVEHPGFLGSYSLKNVLPALVDDLSYDGLEVRDGRTASVRYERAILGQLEQEERKKVCEDLKSYCATDTLAELRLFQKLCRVCR